MSERIVIVGAGQAGMQGAASARQAGFGGEIVILGAEPAPPYQRPPLSKAFLKGELHEERLYLRQDAFYEKQAIELDLGAEATAIDLDAQTVVAASGRTIAYDKLLLATGAPPRRLSTDGAALEGVHYLRTLSDSNALRAVMTCDGPVVIIGAGYIGLEVAAVARQAGRDVIVIEMADRVLARVASEPVSAFYQDLHASAGVDIKLGASLRRILGDDGRVAGVELADGSTLACDAVLVGIGAVPAVELAERAGLKVDNGIVVDEYARTSDARIWAAGDCANFPSARYGKRLRLESVPNAIEQAKAAGANMAGRETAYDPLPWFWSDQYDVKLQTVGYAEGFDRFVLRGDPATKSFAVWYFKNGEALAVDAINDPASFAVGKALILRGKAIDEALIADTEIDLKSLL